MYRTVTSLLLGVLLLSVSSYAAQEKHVVIMHTNDLHGRLLEDAETSGVAALATIVRRERPDLMLDAGDMFAGALISDAFQGEPVIDIMNEIGYDAAAIGSYEFSFGMDTLRARAAQANFPLLSANARVPVDDINPAAIFNAQGVRIGIIGLTTEEITRTGHPRNTKYVDVDNVIMSLENMLPRVREKVDLVILLTHLTRAEEQRVAKAFPEIQLIISGNDDNDFHDPIKIGDTTVVRAGRFGRYVGRIDLTFNDRKLAKMETRMIPVAGADRDASVERMIGPYEMRLNRRLQTVVGQATADFPGSPASESPVGNLLADAIREKTGSAIALVNISGVEVGGGKGIAKGPITSQMLVDVLPSQSTVVTMKLSGAQIKRILGRRLMTVSGVRVKIDANKPEGKRLISVRLEDGSPLRDKEFYSVTTNDFLFSGGDGFTEFAEGLDVEDTGVLMRDALAEHIARLGTVAPRLDGRIQVLSR